LMMTGHGTQTESQAKRIRKTGEIHQEELKLPEKMV